MPLQVDRLSANATAFQENRSPLVCLCFYNLEMGFLPFTFPDLHSKETLQIGRFIYAALPAPMWRLVLR